MQPENLEKNVYLYDLEVAAEINTERMETYNTNLNMQTMLTREVVVTMSSESEGKEVKFDDEIEYDVNIKVNGSSRKFKDIDLNVLDYLPDELIPEEVEYEIFTYNEETENYEYSKLTEDISSKIVEDDEKTSPDVKLFITIPNGLETNIKIKAKADLILENKEVLNSVSVTTGESDTIISNIVKFTILAGDYDNDESESDTPTYPDEDDEEDTKDNEDKKDEENIDKGTYEISGQVWIDTNKDGRKDDKEQKVSGVKVKLFNMATNAIVTNPNGEKYIITTDKEGKYKFSNLPNGKYLVIFEYDNDTIRVTVRRTDALDNYKRREDIDNQMRYVTNNTLESMINNAYTSEGQKITKPDGTVEDIITSMDSTTPTMAFSVEYETTVTNGDDSDRIAFVVNNIDFGIVERAKQALDFSKRITGYKIKLANDQVLVDAKIDEKGNLTGIHEYTTYLKPSVTESGINIGQLKTEMDNELIEGATLETTYEMKVTNVGELDYSTADYYYYGIKDENNIVTVSVTELLDYVDGRLNNLDPDKQWIETDQEHLKEVNASMKNNTDIDKYRTYLTKELAKPLIPSKDTTKNSNTIELHTSKLLTFTDDNTFNNKSEISQVTKNEKGFIGTPVKLIENYFNIGDSEEIIIIPSTGENKNYIVPIIIGIISIAILGGGIILIKKFVIDK